MKPYTPNTPRLALAVAAATVSVATMVTLIGLPMALESDPSTTEARYTTKALIASARRDVGVAGELMAAATTVRPTTLAR